MTDQPQLAGTSEESVPCFIRKTYKILEDEKYSDIISWNQEGTAIIIKNPTAFAQTILPTYFKHNNLNSFIRQLNMYDFHKKKTPDGDHVYYHELFQRGKKHLLKNIRRKNAESSTLNTEKSRLGLELVRTKQDIAAIVNENLLLKKINNEAVGKINALESKVNELTFQNQALWSQIVKYNEKEENLKSFIPTLKRETPFYPLTNIDINANQIPQETTANKVAQTTTKIPQFSGENANSRNWNFKSENYDEANMANYLNIKNENKPQFNNETKRKRGSLEGLKSPNFLESDFAADLSQQIVKNMDQELQYLKKLTSSNKRPPTNLSMTNSPDSVLLGKRRIETDPGYQNFNSYENFSKIYKPDPVLGINFLSNNLKGENEKGFEDEE